jgi:hypothetical protein
MRKTVIAGLTRNLLTCSFQILSLAFGDLRMTVSRIFTQAVSPSFRACPGIQGGAPCNSGAPCNRGASCNRGAACNSGALASDNRSIGCRSCLQSS